MIEEALTSSHECKISQDSSVLNKSRYIGTFIIVLILPWLVAMGWLRGRCTQPPGASAGEVRTDPAHQGRHRVRLPGLTMGFILNTFHALLFSICRHFTSWEKADVRQILSEAHCPVTCAGSDNCARWHKLSSFPTAFHFCLFFALWEVS